MSGVVSAEAFATLDETCCGQNDNCQTSLNMITLIHSLMVELHIPCTVPLRQDWIPLMMAVTNLSL